MRSDRRFIAGVVLLALLVRSIALGRDDLWADEIHTLQAIELDWRAMIVERFTQGHVPGYFAIAKAWSIAAGTSQAALRGPSVAFGALAIVPLFAVARRLSPSAGAARWTVVLLAAHPLLIELSREARMYPLLLLVGAVFVAATLRILDGGAGWAWLFPAAIAGPLIHPTWAFMLVPLLAAVLWSRSDGEPRRRRGIVLACLLSAAVTVAVLLPVDAQTGQELLRRPWWREIGVFVVRLVAGAGVREHFLLWYALLLAASTWCAVRGWSLLDARARRFAVCLGPGVVAAGGFASVFGLTLGPMRYVQFATIGMCLVIGAGASTGRARWLLVPALVLVLGLRFVPARTAWSTALAGVDPALPLVLVDPSARMVAEHYAGRPVSIGDPPAGAAAWIELAANADEVRVIERP